MNDKVMRKTAAIGLLVEDMLRVGVVFPPPRRTDPAPAGEEVLDYDERLQGWASDLAGIARHIYDAAETRIDIELDGAGIIDRRVTVET